MKVICISERSSRQNQIRKGDFYRIDRDSIWIDADGDAYGSVFAEDGTFVGQMLISHFCSA